jgi:hypothetical protein
VAAEDAGVPSASIVITGFLGQADAVASSEGMANLAIAEYPGVPITDSDETVKNKVRDIISDNIIRSLTSPPKEVKAFIEPDPNEVVFEGTLEEVNNYFEENLWTDGLPIIPPTIEQVKRFLEFTDRAPDDVIGILPPEKREATVWNIAVNGAMAGCRPEYMPLLIAVVEAIAEPEFRLQDAGSTPGWEPLVIVNGPLVKQLGFNYEAGAMRVGRRANSSVGRFLRLYMRNVAGFRIPPGKTDKGCFGFTFNVALAENEDAVREMGWKPFSVQRGFKQDENIVTVQSVVYISPPTYSGGEHAVDHLETIAKVIGRNTASYWTFNFVHWAKCFPVIVMSPSVAQVLARGGYSQEDVKRYLYENVKTEAGENESFARQMGQTKFSFKSEVLAGNTSKEYCESNDPERMIPVFQKPEWIGILVSGDPDRNQSKGYINNHEQGAPISKKVTLPKNWNELIK